MAAQPGAQALGLRSAGRIELGLVEPGADDEQAHLIRLGVPFDDVDHFAPEEGAPVRLASIDVGEAVFLRQIPA